MAITVNQSQTIHSQHKQRFYVQQQVTQQLIVTNRVRYQSENVQMFSTAVIPVRKSLEEFNCW